MKQTLMFILLVVALMTLLVVIVITLSLPANAHSEAELESWLVEYERMTTQAEVPPWPTLAGPIVLGWKALLTDMQHRHPCSKALKTWTETCKRSSRAHSDPSGFQGMGNDVEQWRSLVAAYFSTDKVNMALCVMAGESGGNPTADNPRSSAAGLFQFLQSTWDNMVPIDVTGGSYLSGQVYDPESNVRAAAWLQANAGWSQWNAASRC